jgi:chromosome segregation ATPase
MTTPEEKLETSKDKLRAAFARLEDAVDKKIQIIENRAKAQVANAQKQGDMSVLRREMDDMNNEMTALREQNGELQDRLNKAEETVRKLKSVNQEAAKRVDGLMQEVKREIA